MMCDDISDVKNTPDKPRELLRFDDNADLYYEDISGINHNRDTYRTNPS